jgi:hypothetical protein
MLPLQSGLPERRTHDYVRHATTGRCLHVRQRPSHRKPQRPQRRIRGVHIQQFQRFHAECGGQCGYEPRAGLFRAPLPQRDPKTIRHPENLGQLRLRHAGGASGLCQALTTERR